MYEKTVEYGQDIFDLSIQEYGTVNAVFMLLFDNPAIGLGTFLTPGTFLKFRHEPPTDIVDSELMVFFRKNEIRVNNNDEPPAAGGNWQTVDGGDWWTVPGEGWQTVE